jgi:aldose epimerase family protein
MESTINTLKYGNIEIAVADRGAELRSYKVDGEEFMWDRKPEFWAASSPVLFPFVGTIKNGAYSFDGKSMKFLHGMGLLGLRILNWLRSLKTL